MSIMGKYDSERTSRPEMSREQAVTLMSDLERIENIWSWFFIRKAQIMEAIYG